MSCHFRLGVHILRSQSDFYHENLEALGEEQSEIFHKDIKDMEISYHGTWAVNMLAYGR